MKLLNLGCGRRYHPDWVNVDKRPDDEAVLSLDLRAGLPFGDDSFDVVYHSHVLEHFTRVEGAAFVKECFRVLKPGGILRVAVPDLESLVVAYIRNLEKAKEGDEAAALNYDWIKLELIDQFARNESGGEVLKTWHRESMPNEAYVLERVGFEFLEERSFYLKKKMREIAEGLEPGLSRRSWFRAYLKSLRDGLALYWKWHGSKTRRRFEQVGRFRMSGEIHQWMYDEYSLIRLLKQTGFREMNRVTAFDSHILRWEVYRDFLDVQDGQVRKPDSLFMEAIK